MLVIGRPPPRTASGVHHRLDPKLLQVMIEMLIHPGGPLLGREPPEEAMGMCCATIRPPRCKSVNHVAQSLSLCFQISFIIDYQNFHRRGVPAHRHFLSKRSSLYHPTDDS